MVFGGDSDDEKFENDHRRAPDEIENAGATSGGRSRRRSEEAGDKEGEEEGKAARCIADTVAGHSESARCTSASTQGVEKEKKKKKKASMLEVLGLSPGGADMFTRAGGKASCILS